MRIFAISDLHLSLMVEKPMDIFGGEWENYTTKIKENWQNLVSEDDVVLVAGDISWAMRKEETIKDLEFLGELNGKKIIIKGNHEYWWKSLTAVREMIPDNVIALQHDSIRFGDYLITGTRGWEVPENDNDLLYSDKDQKLYEREQIRLELALEHMQKQRKEDDKVICMIHFPPFNSKKEDSAFTKLFEKYNVDIVVFGHLHKNIGKYNLIEYKNNIKYYLTSADLIGMKPIEIY